MELALQVGTLRIQQVELCGEWIFGTLIKPGEDDRSPRAPWVQPWKGLPRFIENRTVTTGLAEFFYSADRRSFSFLRQLNEDVLPTFAGIQPGDTNAMLQFLKDNGVFAEEDLYLTRRFPSGIQHRWKRARASGGIAFAVEMDTLWQVQWEISMLNELYASLGEKDLERARELCVEIGVGAEIADNYAEYSPANIRRESLHLLGTVMGKNLMSARIVPVEHKGSLAAWAAVSFVRDALFLHLMDAIVKQRPMRRCKNSRCPLGGGVFQPRRPDQEYCGEPCRNYVKRYRHLKKSIERESPSLETRVHRRRRRRVVPIDDRNYLPARNRGQEQPINGRGK